MRPWIILACIRHLRLPSRLTWVQKLNAWESYQKRWHGLRYVSFDFGESARRGEVGIERLAETAYKLLTGEIESTPLDTEDM